MPTRALFAISAGPSNRVFAGLLLAVVSLADSDQLRERHSQAMGELDEGAKRRVDLPPLDRADVVAVQARASTKLLLRDEPHDARLIPTLLGNDEWRAAVLPHVAPATREFPLVPTPTSSRTSAADGPRNGSCGGCMIDPAAITRLERYTYLGRMTFRRCSPRLGIVSTASAPHSVRYHRPSPPGARVTATNPTCRSRPSTFRVHRSDAPGVRTRDHVHAPPERTRGPRR